MKISEVFSFPFSIPMRGDPTSLWDDEWSAQLFSVVKGTGPIYGIGESLLAGGIPPEVPQYLINHFLSDILLGKEIEPLEANEIMLKSVFSAGLGGITSIAVSGIDVAIWDLWGKTEGKSIADMLQKMGYKGDPNKEENGGLGIPVYASFPRYASCEDVLKAAGIAVKTNHTMVKLHQPPRLILDCVKKLRRAFPELKIAVDLNCGFNLQGAIDQLSSMQKYEVEWFEEPLWPPDDYENLRKLSGMGFPIAAGEDEYRGQGFEQLCNAGVEYLQPDLSKVGGVTGFLRAVEVAKKYGVKVAPHVRPHLSYINEAATLAVATVFPEIALVEFPLSHYSEEAFTNLPKVSGGKAIIKRAPGIGTDFKLLKYAYREKFRGLRFADLQ